MTPPLFLVDHLDDHVTSGSIVELDGNEGRHATRVRRVRVGENVLVGDGFGTVLTGRVCALTAVGLRVEVGSRHVEPRPDPRVTVVQALAKAERSELAVELLTEVGVDTIVPWAATRSIVQWRDSRGARGRERWIVTAREAAKQSRRAWIPEVARLATPADVAERIASAASGLVLDQSAGTSLATVPLPHRGEIVLIVGPEGGIDPGELAQFTAGGGIAVRLGSTVLRTSTAGAAALAVLSARLGRWT